MAKIIPDFLETVPATVADYSILARYHYNPLPKGPCTGIYKIKAKYPYHKSMPDPLAIIVYRMPIGRLRARTIATNGIFKQSPDCPHPLKAINKNIRYLARLIVDPRFWRHGLATKLILETLELQNVPLIETITPIDWTNDMFVKCGFELTFTPAPRWYRRMTNAIRSIGLTPDTKLLPITLHRRTLALKGEQRKSFEWEIKQFLHQYRHMHDLKPSIARAKFILSKIPYPEAYLLWHNPKIETRKPS